jgi:hypothetical protein
MNGTEQYAKTYLSNSTTKIRCAVAGCDIFLLSKVIFGRVDGEQFSSLVLVNVEVGDEGRHGGCLPPSYSQL